MDPGVGDIHRWPGRTPLARHLVGSGLELGPGHIPFDLPFPGVTVRYADRWQPEENLELFPELPSDAGFVAPDIVTNFDTERLRAVADESQDFVICSHVLEHLAEPIGFLDDMYRVLKPGGVALILLPDRRRTWDHLRAATTLEHLVEEYRRKVTEVDADHIVDFLEGNDRHFGSESAQGAREDPDYLELHRKRSIHVHCWADEEFVPVILFTIEQLNHRWDFVDGILTDEFGPDSFEFGFVLRRIEGELGPTVMKRRFEDSWVAWRDARRLACAVNAARAGTDGDEASVTQERDAALAELEAIRRTRTFRYTASARRGYGNVLRFVRRFAAARAPEG